LNLCLKIILKTELYYKQYENRVPYSAQKMSVWKSILFQFFSIVFIGVSSSYLFWRWTVSLNTDALWFSVPLVVAETLMFLGSVLMIINHWSTKNISSKPPIRFLSEMDNDTSLESNRPIKIDLFIATYNEEKAIAEDTIRDVKQLNYPFSDVEINIYLCDDGHRNGTNPDKENFKKLAEDYGIHYLFRENNIGFKAGNLNSTFWQTDGDLLVILDADTRVFPDFLIHLTGYFRDEKMAWVQSPQWFYDITDGKKLSEWLNDRFPVVGKTIAAIIPFSNKITVGKNILGTDPRIFYDVILQNRNAANAAFCCGAGSVHRRKALEDLIFNQSKRLLELNSSLPFDTTKIKNKTLIAALNSKDIVIGPFVHHISEDIYTSILLHSDKKRWKSYQHPDVECKMLSPQSLQSYSKQFSRYAEGTYDLFFSRDNPLIKKGLSLGQRLAYAETLYSYFSPFWILIFLLCPIVFYFSLVPPIKAFNFDFFLRFITLNILNQIIITIGNWGIHTKRSEQYFIGSFWIKLLSFLKIVSGKKLQFNTTSKLKGNLNFANNIKLVIPHLIITMLTLAGLAYNLVLVSKNIHPSYSAFFANTIWALYNIYQMNPIIRTAFKK